MSILAARLRERLSAESWPTPPRLLPTCLLLAALLLRMAPLGRYVTPDEPAWVHRSIQFGDALAAGDWAAVPVTGHPGVTTMWLGSAGVLVSRLTAPTDSAEHLGWIRLLPWLAPENGEAFHHLAFFLSWGRIAVALATTTGLGVTYLMLARLLGQRVALLTLGLLALDPYLAGHSGLLHTDGLLATFSLLALVSAVTALNEPFAAPWWALAGLFAGLTVLTKGPGLVVMAFVLAGVALGALRAAYRATTEAPQVSVGKARLYLAPLVRYLAISLPVCLGAIGLTTWTLYPALWGNPIEVIRTVATLASGIVESSMRTTFFIGHMTHDPGPLFYPVALLVRISPLVLIGLAVGIARWRHFPSGRRATILGMVAFALFWGIAISLGTKKYDRYLLPLLPPLTLAAVLAAEEAVGCHVGRVVLAQLLLLLPFARYPLAQASPLVGGPWGAARMLAVDWGEGMGASARRLNEHGDARRMTVAALSVPSFAPLFAGRTVPLDQASLADYVVTDPGSTTPNWELARTERLAFTDRAATYTNTAPLEQATYLAQHVSAGELVVLDAETSLARHYAGPGNLSSVADMVDQAAMMDQIRSLVSDDTVWLVSDSTASPITTQLVRALLDSAGTMVSTETVGSATIGQFRLDERLETSSPPFLAAFGEHFRLLAIHLPEIPLRDSFPAFLRWQALWPSPSDLHATLYVRDEQGQALVEVGQLVVNGTTFPTSAWIAGEWADTKISVKLPPRILPGRYTVEATVTDGGGAGHQMGAWDADGRFLGVRVILGEIQILPPERPEGPPACAAERTLSFGPLLACTAEPAAQTVFSGDSLTVPIVWSMTRIIEDDLGVHWRLIDDTGAIVREHVLDLAPHPTSLWRAGDSYEATYDWRIDPLLPPGTYTLTLNTLAPDGTALRPVDETLYAIEVLARERTFELPRHIDHPLDLTLGNVVHLRGFDVALPSGTLGSAATMLRPGDEIPLTLYWQGDGPTDLNYSVFVHLVGPDGQPHGQVDGAPAAGEAPTASWAPGQVVVDELVLPVDADAPAGPYRVIIGMYDATSGGRLPITDSSGQRLTDDQAILPVAIAVSRGRQ